MNHLQFFKEGEIMVSKYGQLMPPGEFPDTIAPDTGFIDEIVVNCHVSVVKILL